MLPWRSAIAGLVFAWASTGYAQAPIAAFAAGQLRFAETALESARQAHAAGDLVRARHYSEQAELDARLAWSMSQSAYMRRAAAEVARDVARLRSEMAGQRADRGQKVTDRGPQKVTDLPMVDLTSTVTRR